jgi:hypothetical protein
MLPATGPATGRPRPVESLLQLTPHQTACSDDRLQPDGQPDPVEEQPVDAPGKQGAGRPRRVEPVTDLLQSVADWLDGLSRRAQRTADELLVVPIL